MKKMEQLKELGWETGDILELLKELVGKFKEENGIDERESGEEITEQIDMNKRVTELLRDIGIPFNINGMIYIRYAILYCLECEQTISITKILYPAVAKEFDTTSSRVERAIRHAVERAFDKCNPVTESIFGYTINPMKGKPTNSEFIWMIVEYLKIS